MMKRARLTEKQIIGILQEHEADAKCADLCRKHGMSENTFPVWKAKYSGMAVLEDKQLKALGDENARLKELLAEQMLDMAAMRELLQKNGDGRREARGCRAFYGPSWAVGTAGVLRAGADRKMVRYRSPRAPDTALHFLLRDLVNKRRSFDDRRLFVLLSQEGKASGINRIYSLYREEGLTVCKRKVRHMAIGTRALILIEARANACWSLNFLHDQFACGRRFRVLNVLDDVTRECLAAIRSTSISGRRLALGADRADRTSWEAGHDRFQQWHRIDVKRCLEILLRAQG